MRREISFTSASRDQRDQEREHAKNKKGTSCSCVTQLQLRGMVISLVQNIEFRSRVLSDQMSGYYLKVWTGKDNFATHLRNVPVLYRYTHRSHYDYATSAGELVPRQMCLFNSTRE